MWAPPRETSTSGTSPPSRQVSGLIDVGSIRQRADLGRFGLQFLWTESIGSASIKHMEFDVAGT